MTPSTLQGGKGFLANLYRAFRGMLTPTQVDACELWQLAVLLDGDIRTAAGTDGLAAQHARIAEVRARDKERILAERAAAQARLGDSSG